MHAVSPVFSRAALHYVHVLFGSETVFGNDGSGANQRRILALPLPFQSSLGRFDLVATRIWEPTPSDETGGSGTTTYSGLPGGDMMLQASTDGSQRLWVLADISRFSHDSAGVISQLQIAVNDTTEVAFANMAESAGNLFRSPSLRGMTGVLPAGTFFLCLFFYA
jgi:hypothetical protein